MSKLILILATGLALAGPAAAQTVWRCGNSYSQEPCPGGTAVSVAERVTTRPVAAPAANVDARLAADMEKARLAQERNAPKAVVIGAEKPVEAVSPAAAKAGTKAKTGKLEQFTAVSPKAPGEEKKKEKKGKGKKESS